jgi:hypothetical protein
MMVVECGDSDYAIIPSLPSAFAAFPFSMVDDVLHMIVVAAQLRD